MSQPNANPSVPSASAKADLVERARAGDHTAFAILARNAFGRMYGAAKLILRDQYGAEDAVQEAFSLPGGMSRRSATRTPGMSGCTG